jgi:hypothetical protein
VSFKSLWEDEVDVGITAAALFVKPLFMTNLFPFIQTLSTTVLLADQFGSQQCNLKTTVNVL